MQDIENLKDIEIPELVKWFESFILKYRIEDPSLQFHIDLKHKHTLNVCKNCVQIGKALNLENKFLQMLWVIGLFHDVARFPQFHEFHTFKDHLSYNHAEKAVEILNQEKILDIYFHETKDHILQAIQLHNRAELPLNLPSNILLLANIIRDADKLDILRFFVEYYTTRRNYKTIIDLELPDDPEITPAIINSIQTGKPVKLSSIRTMNDFKLMQFRWVYELNYVPSRQILKEMGYIEQIYKTMPANPLIQDYYQKITQELNRELN